MQVTNQEHTSYLQSDNNNASPTFDDILDFYESPEVVEICSNAILYSSVNVLSDAKIYSNAQIFGW